MHFPFGLQAARALRTDVTPWAPSAPELSTTLRELLEFQLWIPNLGICPEGSCSFLSIYSLLAINRKTTHPKPVQCLHKEHFINEDIWADTGAGLKLCLDPRNMEMWEHKREMVSAGLTNFPSFL